MNCEACEVDFAAIRITVEVKSELQVIELCKRCALDKATIDWLHETVKEKEGVYLQTEEDRKAFMRRDQKAINTLSEIEIVLDKVMQLLHKERQEDKSKIGQHFLVMRNLINDLIIYWSSK